jgi:hypothetical protein
MRGTNVSTVLVENFQGKEYLGEIIVYGRIILK